jgi:hypothetical protein
MMIVDDIFRPKFLHDELFDLKQKSLLAAPDQFLRDELFDRIETKTSFGLSRAREFLQFGIFSKVMDVDDGTH